MALPLPFVARFVTLVVTFLLATTLGLLALAEPAAARVSIVPGTVKGGGTETFAVRLANERQDESSNRFVLVFPKDVPISSVEVAPVEGWTVTVHQRPLARLAEVDGQVVREVAASIVWEGDRVGPGQYEQFLVTLGPLPRDGRLAFTATQSYTDGDTDTWTDATAAGRQDSTGPTVTIGSGRVATPTASASPAADDAAPVDRGDSTNRRAAATSTATPDGPSDEGDLLTPLLLLVLAGVGVVTVIALVRQVRAHTSAAVPNATGPDASGDTDRPDEAEPEADDAEPVAAESKPAATEASHR